MFVVSVSVPSQVEQVFLSSLWPFSMPRRMRQSIGQTYHQTLTGSLQGIPRMNFTPQNGAKNTLILQGPSWYLQYNEAGRWILGTGASTYRAPYLWNQTNSPQVDSDSDQVATKTPWSALYSVAISTLEYTKCNLVAAFPCFSKHKVHS